MKTLFYYLSGKRINEELNRKENVPVITVCLVQDEVGVVSRGIAICSANDNFSKKIGRKLAGVRAMVAATTMRNHHPVRNVYDKKGSNVIASALVRLMANTHENSDIIIEAREHGIVFQGHKAAFDVAMAPLCMKERYVLKSFFDIEFEEAA